MQWWSSDGVMVRTLVGTVMDTVNINEVLTMALLSTASRAIMESDLNEVTNENGGESRVGIVIRMAAGCFTHYWVMWPHSFPF
jgi:hypothetical protein